MDFAAIRITWHFNDGLESCGLLLDCCGVFITYLDSRSLQRIHWWASDIMLNFSKSVSMKKQTNLHIVWPEGEIIFFWGWDNCFFWVNCSFKMKLRFNTTDSGTKRGGNIAASRNTAGPSRTEMRKSNVYMRKLKTIENRGTYSIIQQL